MGKAFDLLSSTAPALGPVIFKSKTGDSKDKLQAVFIPAAQDAAFKDLKRSQKFVVRISKVSLDNLDAPVSPYGTFAWRLAEDEYFSAENKISDYSGATTALELKTSAGVASGVYMYWDSVKGSQDGDADDFTKTKGLLAEGDIYEFTLDWNEGETFDSSDSNTAHQLAECSGRGTCDYDSGKCNCLAGYSGEACQRSEYTRTQDDNRASARFLVDFISRFLTLFSFSSFLFPCSYVPQPVQWTWCMPD